MSGIKCSHQARAGAIANMIKEQFKDKKNKPEKKNFTFEFDFAQCEGALTFITINKAL